MAEVAANPSTPFTRLPLNVKGPLQCPSNQRVNRASMQYLQEVGAVRSDFLRAHQAMGYIW